MDDSKDEISLLDLIIVILKRRKLIISSFLVGVLITTVAIGYLFIKSPKIDFQSQPKQINTFVCKTELILQSPIADNLKIDLGIPAESYLASSTIQKLLSAGNSLVVKYEPTKKVISYALSGINDTTLLDNSKLILNVLTIELRQYLDDAINLVIAKQEAELEQKPDVELKNPSAYIDTVRKMAETGKLYISVREHETSIIANGNDSNYTKFIILPFGFLFFAIVLAFVIEYFSKIKADPVLYERFLQESGLKKKQKE